MVKLLVYLVAALRSIIVDDDDPDGQPLVAKNESSLYMAEEINKVLQLNQTIHQIGLDSRMQRETMAQLISHLESIEDDTGMQERNRRGINNAISTKWKTYKNSEIVKRNESISKVIDGIAGSVKSFKNFHRSSTLEKIGTICEAVQCFGPVISLIPGGSIATSLFSLGGSIFGAVSKKEEKPLREIVTEAVEDAKNAVIEKIDDQTETLQNIIVEAVEDAKNAIIQKIYAQTELMFMAQHEGEINLMLERQILLAEFVTLERNLTKYEIGMLSDEQWYLAGAGFIGVLRKLVEKDLQTEDVKTARRVVRYVISFIKLSQSQQTMRSMYKSLMNYYNQPTISALQEHRDEQALLLLDQVAGYRYLNGSSSLVYWQFSLAEVNLLQQFYKSLGGSELPYRYRCFAEARVRWGPGESSSSRFLNNQRNFFLHTAYIDSERVFSAETNFFSLIKLDFCQCSNSIFHVFWQTFCLRTFVPQLLPRASILCVELKKLIVNRFVIGRNLSQSLESQCRTEKQESRLLENQRNFFMDDMISDK